jgi:hypothetical protein
MRRLERIVEKEMRRFYDRKLAEFYQLPLPEQRRILGLAEGENPSAPPWLKARKPIAIPRALR